MYKKICITNRHLVRGDFLKQIRRVLNTRPSFVILREKDLSDEEYKALAVDVLNLCRQMAVPCYFNGHPEQAIKLGADGVQLSFQDFTAVFEEIKGELPTIGVSVHTPEEALEAQDRGASYVIYGHVFETACKPGLTPKGLEALSAVCSKVMIPVYAIGGIEEENTPLCIAAGASGVCMMSQFMRLD